MPHMTCKVAGPPEPFKAVSVGTNAATVRTTGTLLLTWADGTTATIQPLTYGAPLSGPTVDAQHFEWLIVVQKGLGTFTLIKVADYGNLDTLLSSATWEVLATLVAHTVRPWQPVATDALAQQIANQGANYVKDNTSCLAFYSGTVARILSLWSGSANSTPPLGWQARTFDESAWPAAVLVSADPTNVWSAITPASASEQILFREHIGTPPGHVQSVTLHTFGHANIQEVYLNGTAIAAAVVSDDTTTTTASIDPALLTTDGSPNVLALKAQAQFAGDAYIHTQLIICAAPDLTFLDNAQEGDILFYFHGQWTKRHIGAELQVLTVHDGYPVWMDDCCTRGGGGGSGGGSGSIAPTTVTSGTSGTCLDLYNAGTSSNNAPPAGWQAAGFNDSSWATPVAANTITNVPVAGSTAIWTSALPNPASIAAGVGGQSLFRQQFLLGLGTITAATLSVEADRSMQVWINNVFIGSGDYYVNPNATFPIPAALLQTGGANILAILGMDDPTFPPGSTGDRAWVSFKLHIT